jgi:hypothetical protein
MTHGVVFDGQLTVRLDDNTNKTALPGARWHDYCRDRTSPVTSKDARELG